ncbi:fungal-specific transcription factor domain-containing protein [Aspergillus aurantiobrunneus]
MRGPCWTCRNRTMQCDQSRFPCSKCEKAGVECSTKDHCDGQKLRSPASAKPLAPEGSPSLALQDPRMSSLDRPSRFYIDYYNKRICKLYVLYGSDSNPIRNLLSYAMEDVALQNSVVALAARHFANTGHSFDPIDADSSPRFAKAELDALHFKTQTMEALSQSLSHKETCKKDAALATVLLLIFLDLLESGINGWNCHVQGAKALHQSLAESGSNGNADIDRGETVPEIRQFITRELFLIETLGTAFSISPSVYECSVEPQGSRHPESMVRSFLGCPEFLLRAIWFFSNQRAPSMEYRRHDNPGMPAHIRDTIAMLELTDSFDCFEWASNFQQPGASSAMEINQLFMLSQAYKMAALLYGRQVLGTQWTETQDNEELVSRLLGLVEILKNDATLFKCLLWPMFMAGLGSQAKSQQDAVIGFLGMLWYSTSCLNVISASNILRDYWKQKEQPGTRIQEMPDIDGLACGWLLI